MTSDNSAEQDVPLMQVQSHSLSEREQSGELLISCMSVSTVTQIKLLGHAYFVGVYAGKQF